MQNSIFPGNILVIDDQFNLCYQPAAEDPSKKLQQDNFLLLKKFFYNYGFCYSVISDTKDPSDLLEQLKKYQNIRLLVLDLDLDESGDVEEGDIELIKKIVLNSIDHFGYYFLLINSSYSEKWEEIKDEIIQDLNPDSDKRIINFLKYFTDSFDKKLTDFEDKILKLLTNKFSSEIITQFECYLNTARDIAFSSFLDFDHKTWENVYKNLKEDIDSKEHVNLTINNFLFGLLRQQLIAANYSEPTISEGDAIDPDIQLKLIESFNYILNHKNDLDKHPIWTGNLYYISSNEEQKKYCLVITPECDIAQAKGGGYTIIYGFEENIPKGYKAQDYLEVAPPHTIMNAGKNKEGRWKSLDELRTFYKGQGYYSLLHCGINKRHLFLDMRSVATQKEFPIENFKLILRINEPIITDITDKFSALYNRKGIPRIVNKNYFKLG